MYKQLKSRQAVIDVRRYGGVTGTKYRIFSEQYNLDGQITDGLITMDWQSLFLSNQDPFYTQFDSEWLEVPFAGTNIHGPKGVRATEV